MFFFNIIWILPLKKINIYPTFLNHKIEFKHALPWRTNSTLSKVSAKLRLFWGAIGHYLKLRDNSNFLSFHTTHWPWKYGSSVNSFGAREKVRQWMYHRHPVFRSFRNLSDTSSYPCLSLLLQTHKHSCLGKCAISTRTSSTNAAGVLRRVESLAPQLSTQGLTFLGSCALKLLCSYLASPKAPCLLW